MIRIPVRIRTPIAGDHGSHQADSVVQFPEHVARQIVRGNFGHVVDSKGERIDHDFDGATASPLEQDLDELVESEGTPIPASPAATVAGRRSKKKAESSPSPTPEAAPASETAQIDPAEWTQE